MLTPPFTFTNGYFFIAGHICWNSRSSYLLSTA